jgi:hypothetical protein
MAKMMKMSMKMSMKKMGMKKMAMKKMSMKMRKMAMKKSTIAKGKRGKSSVFRGTKVKTVGGLKKSDLKKNKAGKIVSKKASEAAKKKKGYKKIAAWGAAFKAARKALGIKGFCPCGGKTSQGKALLAKTRSLYKK